MRLLRVSLLAAALLAAGCEIPTEPPLIQQRWVLPLDDVTLDQSELLPASVAVVGTLYDVSLAPVGVAETLGTMCPPCQALDGSTIATPAFQATFSSTDNLPTDVVDVAIVSGSVDVTIANGFSFDPIANGGSLTITVAGASGGPVLGTIVLDGDVDSMPPSSVTTRTLVIAGGTVTGATETTVDVVHTGGQVTQIDTSESIGVTAVVTSLLVSEATVGVDGVTAVLSSTDLGIDDIDEGLIDNIQGGAVVLDVQNPFGVTFTGTVSIGTVDKLLAVPADPTSTVTIAFTAAELQAVLRENGALFSGSGTLGGGPALVTPTDKLIVDPTIDLTIEIGG